MITRINSLNTQKIYFRAENKEKGREKKVYTDKTALIMTSLTTAAAVTGGVLLAMKHAQVKRMQQVGEKIIQRPKIFSEQTVNEIADSWMDEGKIDVGERVVILPKSVLYDIAKADKNYKNVLNGMKMSDNAFGITILRSHDDIDFQALQYYDPQRITMLKMVDSIRNGRIYYFDIV